MHPTSQSYASLSDTSKPILDDFFQWCKSNRDQFNRDIDYQYRQYKECRLLENSYTASDVNDILQGMYLVIQGSLNQESSSQNAFCAEYIRAILQQADAQGAKIAVTASIMDHTSAVQEMEKAAANVLLSAPPKSRLLAPLSSSGLTSSTASSVEHEKQLADARAEIQRLNDKIQTITEMFSTSKNEQTLLVNEVNKLREASAAMTGGDASSKVHIQKLSAEIIELKKELSTRMNASPQFLNLKKMMVEKNKMIKQLRTSLAKYEPLTTEEDHEVVLVE